MSWESPRWGFVNALSKAREQMAKAISAKSRVTKYRAKRDFAKTSEPAGKKAVPSSSTLRFVIQRHDARRLHYDFRLELDGVFKSWAVTRGPSLDPHDKRLAVEVEDHPLDYGDFEGTIPKGQYGGGTVQLWDRGYWIPEGDPHEGLKRGDLKFSLEGERLMGSWVLVRMKNDRRGGKRTNWLLIKHRDDDARESDGDALLTDPKSIASGRNLDEIAAGKGKAPTPFITRKPNAAGAVWGSKSMNKPAKSSTTTAMPRFIEPQLCKLAERAHVRSVLGARGQVRRLSHAAPRRKRRRTAPHAEGDRLDCQVRRHGRGRERAPRLPARRRGRGAGQARRTGLRSASGGLVRTQDR
jgi:DNA ligase D-like protein (predicted 3'-phosphoesterase)